MGVEVCVKVPESASIHRWTQGSCTSAAFLWLSPFCLLKISRGAVAEVLVDYLYEHFPWVKTSCTTVEPVCCAAHACAVGPPLSKKPHPLGARSVQLLDAVPKTVGFMSNSHPRGHHSHAGDLTPRKYP